jgi:hypothetical protein
MKRRVQVGTPEEPVAMALSQIHHWREATYLSKGEFRVNHSLTIYMSEAARPLSSVAESDLVGVLLERVPVVDMGCKFNELRRRA